MRQCAKFVAIESVKDHDCEIVVPRRKKIMERLRSNKENQWLT